MALEGRSRHGRDGGLFGGGGKGHVLIDDEFCFVVTSLDYCADVIRVECDVGHDLVGGLRAEFAPQKAKDWPGWS